MEAFDFSALDSEAFDQTLAFLNAYDVAPPLDPALGSFELVNVSSTQSEDVPWSSASTIDWSDVGPSSLTDTLLADTDFSRLGCEMQEGAWQPHQVMPPHDQAALDQSLNKAQKGHCDIDSTTGSLLHNLRSDTSQMSVPGWTMPANSALHGYSDNSIHLLPEFGQPQSVTVLCHLRCDWPSCTLQTTFGNIGDLQNHKTDVHIADVLKTWPGPCSWPGCNCKAVFKTSKRLESHVYNIHVTPLSCKVVGCNHPRPFERQADLDRHVASKHKRNRKFKCPEPECYLSFARKDKFKLHHRNYHERFACHHNHCNSGAPSEGGLRRHLTISQDWRYASMHFYYECGLGSCAFTKPSYFVSTELTWHMQKDHHLSREVIQVAIGTLRASNTWKLTLEHFPNGVPDFQDCADCKELVRTAASENNGNDKVMTFRDVRRQKVV